MKTIPCPSLLCLLGVPLSLAFGQVNVTTNHNDDARTGANLSETVLTPSNVNVSSFGKLFSYAVDGYVFAQPLYVSNVSIGGGTHNVVYVASMENTVYAFDADSNTTYWTKSFNSPGAGITPVPIVDITGNNNLNIHGNVGVLSTPVIDLSTNTIYLLARTKEPGPVYRQKLHALDITNGSEKFGGPVTISASVPGNGGGSSGGTLNFDPKKQSQRPGLALVAGQIIIAWASHEDIGPYHGWVISYNATALNQTGVHCSTPDGNSGGYWMAGQAPAIDSSGNIYVINGNGDWNGSRNFGCSFVKLSSSGLALLDWFTPNANPDNVSNMNANDLDLGAAGPMCLPGTTDLIGGGKQGIMYVLQRGNLGHSVSGNTQIVQQWQAVNIGSCTYHIHGSPVYWNSTANGPMIYVWGENDSGRAFKLAGATFQATAFATTAAHSPTTGCGMPGSMLALSANGGSNGILWANCVYTGDAVHNIVPGILRAYDANNLGNELWDSRQNQARDDIGNFAKYVPPTIANGKVYMSTFSDTINVYGLLSAPPPPSGNAISIDFVGGGTAMGSAESAGVVAKTNWNSLAGASGSTTLIDETGAASGASVSWTANGTFNTGITDTAGNNRMMRGYLDVKDASLGTVSVSNLAAGKTYDVYVCIDGANGGSTRTGAYQISGTGITTTTINATDPGNTDFGGTFTQASNSNGNYVKFSITTTAFTVTITPGTASDSIKRAPVNGLQIIPGGQTSAAAPTFSPGGGTYPSAQSVTISTTTSGAAVRYTTDGSTPTSTTGTLYSSPVNIASTTTLKAIAYKSGLADSTVTSAAYTINLSSGAKSLSVDLVGGGTAMGSAESAGVIAKTNWNNATGATGSGLALKDENGTSTSATLNWTSDHTSASSITDTAGNNRMLRGYANTSNTSPTTLTVAGLAANTNGYDIYVYCVENIGGISRTASYQISGSGITTTTVNATDTGTWGGTFVQANNSTGNYVKFIIGNVGGFTLTAAPVSSTDGNLRAPVNGLQVIPK